MPERRLRSERLSIKAFLLGFVVLRLFTVAVAAEDTAIKAYADKTEVEIGDPIRYSIEVAHPYNLSIQFPTIPEAWGDFELLSAVHKTEPLPDGGRALDTLQLVLAAYKIGDLRIPTIDVTAGERHMLHAPPVPVRVKSVLPAESAENIPPRDVKPVVDLPEPSRHTIHPAFPLAAGAVFLALWLLYLKRKRYRKAAAPAQPAMEDRSPEREALLAIERLLQSAAFAKPFYVQIALVVRVYLEKRYRCKALERTTSEILHEMTTRKQDGRLIELTQRVFHLCDLAKFSTYVPDEEEAYRLAEHAVSLIEIGSSKT